MADLFENPLGLMGFEFVEFASPVANVLEPSLKVTEPVGVPAPGATGFTAAVNVTV